MEETTDRGRVRQPVNKHCADQSAQTLNPWQSGMLAFLDECIV